VLLASFGVEHMMITTVHAYTSSQSLMDMPTRKRRRGRSAALSIVPTTTGAAPGRSGQAHGCLSTGQARAARTLI
jgi:glyceraldehyde-3-phosphate dehydrogenase/erythrose-4-phosphate dehydrogenase